MPEAARPHGIVVEQVSKTYPGGMEDVHALRAVNFQVGPGEFVCVLGASGCGKSTLIGAMAGLLEVDSGSIEIESAAVTGLNEAERAQLRLTTVGVVFQDHHLIEDFRAWENVSLPLEVAGSTPREAKTQAEAELAKVGLAELADRFPSEMSGGQRQRVGIARALAGDRPILLADEPTGSLDSANSRVLFELLRELAGHGTTIVVCTHDLACADYADRLVQMSDGRLIEADERTFLPVPR